MDKTSIIIIIIIVLAGGLSWAWQSGIFSAIPIKPIAIPEGIILFYGEGCSYCKIVDDFINQNNIEEKAEFIQLEVWHNKDNQNILAQVMQKCDIQADQVGIPFLYDGNSKCHVGDVDVINFSKNETGI